MFKGIEACSPTLPEQRRPGNELVLQKRRHHEEGSRASPRVEGWGHHADGDGDDDGNGDDEKNSRVEGDDRHMDKAAGGVSIRCAWSETPRHNHSERHQQKKNQRYDEEEDRRQQQQEQEQHLKQLRVKEDGNCVNFDKSAPAQRHLLAKKKAAAAAAGAKGRGGEGGGATSIGRDVVGEFAPTRRGACGADGTATVIVSPLSPQDAKHASGASASSSCLPSSPSSTSCISTPPRSPSNVAIGGTDNSGSSSEAKDERRTGGMITRHEHCTSSSDRWKALKVSIPRPEVEMPAANVVVADSGRGSADRSDGGFAVSASRVHEGQGGASGLRAGGFCFSQGKDAPTGGGATLAGNNGGCSNNPAAAPINSVSWPSVAGVDYSGTASAASATAARATPGMMPAVVVEGGGSGITTSLSPPKSLDTGRPVIPGIPGAMLEQQQQQRQHEHQHQLCKKYFSVEVRFTEGGEPVYSFNKSAPARRGKWSRLEEEYAKRIINDFDEGVLDAPVGIGLRQVLASKLRCEVMRVSKKFRGWQCVGKRNFQPVFYPDGRTAKARESLYKMEQAWLRTFPCSLKLPGEVGSGAGNGAGPSSVSSSSSSSPPSSLERRGESSTKSLMPFFSLPPAVERDGRNGGSGQKGERTPAQSWVPQVTKRSRASDPLPVSGSTHSSLGGLSSPATKKAFFRTESEVTGKGLRDATRSERGNLDRLVSHAGRDEHRAWPQAQQQQPHQQTAPHVEGRGLHYHKLGGGAGGLDNRADVKGRVWTSASRARSSSDESCYFQGAEMQPSASRLEHQDEHGRGPASSFAAWRRLQAEGLPEGGGVVAGDGDTDPYPVYSKRFEDRRGGAPGFGQRESNFHGGGDKSWSRESSMISVRAPGPGINDAHERARHHQHPRRQHSYAAVTRQREEEVQPREQRQERRVPAATSSPPARSHAGVVWMAEPASRGSKDEERDAAFDGASYRTAPPLIYRPLQEKQQQQQQQQPAPGSSNREASSGCGVRIPAGHADGNERRPFRLKPAILPGHVHTDRRCEIFCRADEQAPKSTRSPEVDPIRSKADYRVALPRLSPPRLHGRSSEQPEVDTSAAREETRTWETSAATVLQRRPVKVPRMLGLISNDAFGGSSGHGDHPRYQQQQEQQQQDRSERSATVTTSRQHMRAGAGAGADADAENVNIPSAAEESRRLVSLKALAGPHTEVFSAGGGSPPLLPPPHPRDHFRCAPTSPRAMRMSSGGGVAVVPSAEYGTVVVGQGGRSSSTFRHFEAPVRRPGEHTTPFDGEREVKRGRFPLAPHPSSTKSVLVGKDCVY